MTVSDYAYQTPMLSMVTTRTIYKTLLAQVGHSSTSKF